MKTRLILPLFILSILFVSGCSVSTEKSPAYLKMKERLAKMEENQKKTRRSIEDLYFEFDSLTQEIEVVKADIRSVATSPQQQIQFASAVKRVESLESQIKQFEQKLVSQKKEMAKNIASVKKSKASRTVASPSSKPRASKSSSRSASRSKPAPKKPSGFYYHVKSGDTLQSVARSYRLSSAELCRANRIPLSALLYSGQSIYIPAMKV